MCFPPGEPVCDVDGPSVAYLEPVLCRRARSGFGGPAYQALIPTLVSPKDLSNAIALNSIQFNLARVIGPMLGGIALTSMGAAWCFTFNGISFIAVIISLLLLPVRPIAAKTGASVLTSIKEGLRFIDQHPGMSPLIAIAFLMTMLGIPIMVFLPVVVRDVFHMGPKVFTLMLCISGAGAVVGALTVAAFGHIHNKGQVALLTLIVLGASMTGFGLHARWRSAAFCSSFERRARRSIRNDQFAGSTDRAGRNAWSCDERL